MRMAKTGSPLSFNSLANSCTCSSIMLYQQNHYKKHLTWNIHCLVNGPLLSWRLCTIHYWNILYLLLEFRKLLVNLVYCNLLIWQKYKVSRHLTDDTNNTLLKCDLRMPAGAGKYSLVRNVQTTSGPSICNGVKPPELEYDHWFHLVTTLRMSLATHSLFPCDLKDRRLYRLNMYCMIKWRSCRRLQSYTARVCMRNAIPFLWFMRDFRLPQRCRWALCSSGVLRSLSWFVGTDVSRKPIGLIFKGQAVQGCLTLKDGTYGLSLNVCNKLPI
jgi:hypothetical protein